MKKKEEEAKAMKTETLEAEVMEVKTETLEAKAVKTETLEAETEVDLRAGQLCRRVSAVEDDVRQIVPVLAAGHCQAVVSPKRAWHAIGARLPPLEERGARLQR